MKQQREPWHTGWPMFVTMFLFVIAMFILTYQAFGGTHNHWVRAYPGFVAPDSVMVRVEQVGTGTQVGSDSILTTLPDSLKFTLDSTKVYQISKFFAYYSGSNYEDPIIEEVSLRLVTATATVSGADMAAIAESTDAELTVMHPGDWAATGGAGSGAYSVTFVTVDTAANDTVLVPHVSLTVRNAAQTTVLANVTSNLNGVTTANLDADTHVIIASITGYSAPTYDSHVVAGTQTDTIWLDRWIPTAPTDTFLCRLYGYIEDVNSGRLARAKLTVTPIGSSFNTCDSTILPMTAVWRLSDDTGYVYIDVLRSSCRTNAKYNITLTHPDDGSLIGKKDNFPVPDASTYRLVF